MSKNSTDAKENRRATDGKISTEDLSSTLANAVSGSGGLIVADLPEDLVVNIDLADINLEAFDSFREGMDVVLRTGHGRMVAYTRKGVLIGYVRGRDTEKVSKLLEHNPTIMISSLHHKGVTVRIVVSG